MARLNLSRSIRTKRVWPFGREPDSLPSCGNPNGSARTGALSGTTVWFLWAALLASTVARALLTLSSSTWAWSIDLQKYLDPVLAWITWSAMVLVLAPPIAKRTLPSLDRAADYLIAPQARLGALVPIAAGLLVWSLPDHTHFTGDFLLRESAASRFGNPASLTPQAFPLELFLHYYVPARLSQWGVADVNTLARIAGALEAGVLAILATALAQELRLRGKAALAAAGVVFFGGYLTILTGLNKSFSELLVLSVAIAVLGLRTLRSGRGSIPLGIALAMALMLHRSALVLVPAAMFPLLRSVRSQIALHRARAWISTLLPVIALLATLPRAIATIVHYDIPTNLAWGTAVAHTSHTSMRGLMLRVADALNIMTVLSPLALPCLPALGIWLRLGRTDGLPGFWRLTLVLPLPIMLVLLSAPQGASRDWDMFSAAGALFSVALACTVGQLLRTLPRFEWICATLTVATAVPTVQLLSLQADAERGLRRVEAFVVDPPLRAAPERGRTWAFLSARYWQLGNLGRAADYAARAAETSPSKGILSSWATFEEMRGHDLLARQVFQRALELDSTDWRNWLGLSHVSLRLANPSQARSAALAALRFRPGNPYASELLRQADSLIVRPVAPPPRLNEVSPFPY